MNNKLERNPESEVSKIPRKVIYGLLVSYISALAIAIVSIQYANYVDNKSNEQWCKIVVVMDDTYQKSPPTMPTGKLIADEMKRLRKVFHC